jgi:SAM-dependent methyltransferase
MQDRGRAVIVGRTSYGGVLNSTQQPLPTGGVLQYPHSDMTTPKGNRIEGRGVVPDIPVELRRADLLAGRDTVLERAVEAVQADPRQRVDAGATAQAREGQAARQGTGRSADEVRKALEFVLGKEPDGELDAANNRALDTLGSLAGLTVAEVGAGQGYFVEKLAQRVGSNGKVYGEDIRADALEELEARAVLRRLPNVKTILGTETDPRLPKQALDLVLITMTMAMVAQPVALLRNIASSLKPGGRLMLIEPVQGQVLWPGGNRATDPRFRTREAFLEIFAKCGFRVDRIDAKTHPYRTIFFLSPEGAAGR